MINLKARFGATYRISLDESATIAGQDAEERLWYYQIPCKYGHVYVHGENTLGAYTNRPNVRSRLLALEGVTVHQMGDRECSVTFAPELINQVAQVLHARRRRVLSPAQRAVLERARALSPFGSSRKGTDSTQETSPPPGTDEPPPGPAASS